MATSAPSRANSTRDGAADAGVAAGDDRRHALELAAAAVVGRLVARRERPARPRGRAWQVLRRQLRGLVARAGLHRRPSSARCVLVLSCRRPRRARPARLDAARGRAPVAAGRLAALHLLPVVIMARASADTARVGGKRRARRREHLRDHRLQVRRGRRACRHAPGSPPRRRAGRPRGGRARSGRSPAASRPRPVTQLLHQLIAVHAGACRRPRSGRSKGCLTIWSERPASWRCSGRR